MKTDTAKNIVEFIKKNGQTTAKQLYDHFEISPQAIFRQLKKLVENKKLIKQGKPPKVFYKVKKPAKTLKEYRFSKHINATIEDHFYAVTPSGEEKRGINGFIYWCEKRKLDVESHAKDYVTILKKCSKQKKGQFNDRKQFRISKRIHGLRRRTPLG
ncbi:MAG: winged helix-turn-helix transcriptional regulator [Alphaproteobacteria bacterium]